MTIQHCRACNIPLINRRSHAKTCSNKCRNVVWRRSKMTNIPVNLIFSFTHYSLITKAANAVGKSVNQYVHDRAVQRECK